MSNLKNHSSFYVANNIANEIINLTFEKIRLAQVLKIVPKHAITETLNYSRTVSSYNGYQKDERLDDELLI